MNQSTYWLSFCVAERSVGVILVDAPSFEEALRRVNEAGVNPGGEIMSIEITSDMKREIEVEKDLEGIATLALPRLKLMTRSQMEEVAKMKSLADMTPDERSEVERYAESVHEGCNGSSVKIVGSGETP